MFPLQEIILSLRLSEINNEIFAPDMSFIFRGDLHYKYINTCDIARDVRAQIR
jgi:hypothetical protein